MCQQPSEDPLSNEPAEETGPKTQGLLDAWRNGDSDALDRLIPLIYQDLRIRAKQCFANERADHTLQPTALVSEAYLSLYGIPVLDFENRRQLLAYLTKLMRRILIDHSRRRGAEKRGGNLVKEALKDPMNLSLKWRPEEKIAFKQALDQLRRMDPSQAEMIDLRLLGLGLEEIAEAVESSKSTVHRELNIAKLWLQARLESAQA